MVYIPYGKQSITPEDIQSVVEVLQSDWLTQGPKVEQFEKAISDYCGVAETIAVCNATAGLHLACMALDVAPGDVVWTSPNTFLATANCVRYCGANVDFVDICPKTYNLSVEELKKNLIIAREKNCLPKVVIAVHFAGQSCDMKEIKKLSEEFGFKIIEDASHAIGAKYLNKPVGNCEYSDICIFSFHPVKIMTTGEGGAVVTNNKVLAKKIKLLRTHGMTREFTDMFKETEGPWYYEQITLGYNYRITDLQCALGLKQLARVTEFVNKRHKLASIYNEALNTLPIILPFQDENAYSSFHLYVIQLDKEKTKKNRKSTFEYLKKADIGVNVHYIPVHLQPYYQKLGFRVGDFPTAESYYQQAITLPLYYDLSFEQQNYVIESLRKAFA